MGEEEKGEERWEEREYAGWLEELVKDIIAIDPDCMAFEMIDRYGMIHTSYWRVSQNDRAQMIAGMQDDDRMAWLVANREEILELLNADDEGEGEEG